MPPNMLADAAEGAFEILALKTNPASSGLAGYDPGANGTIPASPAIQRVNPAASRTGVIMAIPTGNRAVPALVTIINENAANTITFAASGSNVSNGSSCVVAAASGIILAFDDNTQIWYPVGLGT